MNNKKIISCLIAAMLILMTCMLCSCRKDDGDVGGGSNHKPSATNGISNPTTSPTNDLGGDIENDIVDPIKSMMPDSMTTANP